MTERMKFTGKTVLVTGGAGFIGSELVAQLTVQGATVKVVDNLVNGRLENLERLPDERLEIHVLDVRDQVRMRKILKGIDIVFHLACLGVRQSIHAPFENHDVNATATLKLLAAARDVCVSRFVYVSSSEVYGTAKWVPMTEEHPTFPMTVYGASKLAGECYSRAYYCSYGYPTVIIRPFNSYGPHCHHEGDSGEVIPKFMLRCMAGLPMVVFGDGKQTRDFTFVSDTARGILLAGLSDAAIGQTINLGNGTDIAVNELADQVCNVVGRRNVEIQHSEARPGDVLRLCAESRRARTLLGFVPHVQLIEGLRRLHEWYLALNHSPQELLANEIIHNWKPSARA